MQLAHAKKQKVQLSAALPTITPKLCMNYTVVIIFRGPDRGDGAITWQSFRSERKNSSKRVVGSFFIFYR